MTKNKPPLSRIPPFTNLYEFDETQAITAKITTYYAGACNNCDLHCCTHYSPNLTDEEVATILLKDSTVLDKLDPDCIRNFLILPCPYLVDSYCSIYNSRPIVCKTFPFSFNGLIPTLELCPMGRKIFLDLYFLLTRSRLSPEALDKNLVELSKSPPIADEFTELYMDLSKLFDPALTGPKNKDTPAPKVFTISVPPHHLKTLLKYLETGKRPKRPDKEFVAAVKEFLGST